MTYVTNLNLTPLTLLDIEDLWDEFGDDQESWQWLAGTDPLPRSKHELLQILGGRMTQPGVEMFAIRNLHGEIVGLSAYLDIRESDRHVEIGSTFIARRFRGGKTNFDLKLKMLTEAFEKRDCVRVTLKVNSKNQRSRDAVIRIGAKFEGELRNQRQERDGSWRTAAIYSVIVEEWPEVKAHLENLIAS